MFSKVGKRMTIQFQKISQHFEQSTRPQSDSVNVKICKLPATTFLIYPSIASEDCIELTPPLQQFN